MSDDINRLGMGAMLGMLSGNADAVDAIRPCLGKVISAAVLADDELKLYFQDGSCLRVWDGGQSCCESRWMHTDAELPYYTGAVLRDISIESADVPSGREYEEVHEAQFLHIRTDKGVLDCVTHVNHNGYYGGFSIRARLDQ